MREIFAVALITAFLLFDPASAAAEEKKAKTAEKKAEVVEEKTAAEGHKVPPPPGQAISKGEVQSVDPAGKEPLDDAITCLARTIYWEAKGEDDASMQAIANVVMNRLAHEGFPKTICGVVKQGREDGACQFSWWCDGHPDQAREDEPYARAKEIARKVLNGQLGDRTHGAIYFHHQRVNPSWAKKYIRTAKVGDHVFYKPAGGKAK
jgi:spore germination cell wall hydrolase CwlJ-like protein